MGYVVENDQVICKCFFCTQGKEHPNKKYHTEYKRMSDVLLVAESLDPKDRIPIEFCITCTHIRIIGE